MSEEARGQILENNSLLLLVHLGDATTQLIRLSNKCPNLMNHHNGLN